LLGQHTRSKQPKKCQQYKQEVLGQHTRSKQPKKCQQYKQEVLGVVLVLLVYFVDIFWLF
jgi:hypothetical protein